MTFQKSQTICVEGADHLCRGQQQEGIVGQNRPAQHRQAHEGAVTAVVPTPDGLYCVTAGTDSRIRLWDLQDNRLVCCTFTGRLCKGEALSEAVNALCAVFTRVLMEGCVCSNTLVNYPSPFNRSKKVGFLLLCASSS